MGRLFLLVCALCWTGSSRGQEFKRMPDHRGQSFGLENFLLQPFNLAAQAEEFQTAPKRRNRIHQRDPYSVEYQVRGDEFDMKKTMAPVPRFPSVINNVEPEKPVHELEDFLPPLRPREVQNEGIHGRIPNDRRRSQLPETRKPLERPSEFQITSIERDLPSPSPPTERHRIRVMKRRRKKPTTPQPFAPEIDETALVPPKEETAEEIELNIFTENSEPAVDKTSFYIEHNRDVQEERKKEEDKEVRHKRKRIKPNFEPEEFKEDVVQQIPDNAVEEEKLIGEATAPIPQNELPPEGPTEEHQEDKTILITPTTDTPQEPTHRLKTLLKQQNGQLSLSELLQTQNLSLSDFLKGNPGALSALGANKVNEEKTITEPEPERTKFQPSRAHLPKISPKSRPFSKPNITSTRHMHKTPSTTTEEPAIDLPKKLDIIEITTDRPTYNGFAPKNPRTRGPTYQKFDHKATATKEKANEGPSEKLKYTIKQATDEDKSREDEKENFVRPTPRAPVYRLTTPGQVYEPTVGEHRIVPKRFGEYRPKLRIDRRKSTTEAPAVEEATESETQETSKTSTTTEEIKTSSKPKNRVRIPFMSVNNPEISVILPNKKQNSSTTEKPKERNNARLSLFKRVNADDKNPLSDVTVETKPPETTEAMTSTTTTTTTQSSEITKINDARTQRIITARTTTTTTEAPTTASKPEVNLEIEKKETSDEIVELLKTGSNAERLERILATRNMTLDELLEKRARSSKHPNVTRLFENKTESQPSSKRKIDELTDNFHPSTVKSTTVTVKPALIVPEFPNTKIDNKIPKLTLGRQHESNNFDELFVDESIIRPIKIPVDAEEQREPKSYDNKNNKNNHRIHLNLAPGTEGKLKHPTPIWSVDEKSIYHRNPYGYPSYDLNKNLAGHSTTNGPEKKVEPKVEIHETIVLDTVPRNQNMNQNLKNDINEILKEHNEVKEIHGEEKTFIPPAVKSAIIASGVVMGIALVVFVAIFAACGWKQRQFRLRARSSILNDSINGSGRKVIKHTGTLSPISFKRTALYKKSIEFEDSESSISGSSNTSSYLWNTLKHTFRSRNSTLKNRQEKEEKIQERENRSRRNTLTRDDERSSRRNTLTHEDHHRESTMPSREQELPRRNTLSRDDFRRDSVMSSRRDTSREDGRRNSVFRDDSRRLSTLEPYSFRKIDPERNIIQTSVNFKRGGFNGSSRHFDDCDHFN